MYNCAIVFLYKRKELMKNKKEPKRIVLQVSDEEHKIIKMDAANKGISIREYVMKAVVNQGKLDELRNKND